MKNLRNFGYMFILLVATVFVSCEADGPGGGGNEGFPEVSAPGNGSVETANVGDTLFYTVTAAQGDAELNAITVRGSNADLDVNSFVVDGVNMLNNPFTLSGTDRSSFTKVIGIIVSGEHSDYSIIITDAEGKGTAVEFTINANTVAPTLDFTSMMSGNVTITVDSLQNYPLTGTVNEGGGMLESIFVYKNDVLLDTTNIYWNGPVVASNPFNLDAEHIAGFEDVDLTIRSSEIEETSEYDVILFDINGLSDTLEFSITTTSPTTPVDSYMGVFFNRSGPSNGSFDFEAVENVSSSSTAADVRDLGNVSQTDPTWLQQLESANGAVLKKVVPGVGGIAESFAFGNIQSKEELQGYFDGASDYNSETVSQGDVFAVFTGEGTLAIFEIATINDASDNSDNYEINIKK